MNHILSKKLLTLLKEHGEIKTYTQDEFINLENTEYTVFILDGIAKVKMVQSNSSVFLYYINSINNIVAFNNLFESIAITIQIIALKKTITLRIKNTCLITLLQSDKELKYLLVTAYQQNNHSIMNALLEILSSVENRLWNYLNLRGRLFNTKTLKISKSEIALDLDLPNETISRVLKKLEKKYFLKRDSDYIKLI